MKIKKELVVKSLLVLLIIFIYLPKLSAIYEVPLSMPYYGGTWDEPFSINSGINAMKNGDPRFYMYGGSTVYPYTFFFQLSKWSTWVQPYYKILDKKGDGLAWPYTHKIFPVRPIYQAKIAQIIFFTLLSLVFVVLGTLWIIPFPFLYIAALENSKTLLYYKDQLLPESHLILFSGLTILGFMKALLARDSKVYWQATIFTAVCASLTISAKISAGYICLLPLSLFYREFNTNEFTFLNKLRGIKKKAVWFFAALILPYIIINPAIILNGRSFSNTISGIMADSRPLEGQWTNHVVEISGFLKEIYLFNILNATLLIVLALVTCALLVRRNVAAFIGFTFFYCMTFERVANTSFKLYTRHFSSLFLPSLIFFIFPLAVAFEKLRPKIKLFLFSFAFIATLGFAPWQTIYSETKLLFTGTFKTQWVHESRDEFQQFVKTKQAKIYFFDFHEFSLPNDIDSQIIPIMDLKNVPAQLQAGEYLGYVRYKNCHEATYLDFIREVATKYKKAAVFGDVFNPPPDFSIPGPKSNPLIVLSQ